MFGTHLKKRRVFDGKKGGKEINQPIVYYISPFSWKHVVYKQNEKIKSYIAIRTESYLNDITAGSTHNSP